jgi:hypothetical protein
VRRHTFARESSSTQAASSVVLDLPAELQPRRPARREPPTFQRALEGAEEHDDLGPGQERRPDLDVRMRIHARQVRNAYARDPAETSANLVSRDGHDTCPGTNLAAKHQIAPFDEVGREPDFLDNSSDSLLGYLDSNQEQLSLFPLFRKVSLTSNLAERFSRVEQLTKCST